MTTLPLTIQLSPTTQILLMRLADDAGESVEQYASRLLLSAVTRMEEKRRERARRAVSERRAMLRVVS